MGKAFKLFRENLSDQEAKKVDTIRKLKKIGVQKAQIQSDFDTAVLNDDDLDEYQQSYESLERKEVVLKRQLQALSKAEASKRNTQLAKEALEETKGKMSSLQKRFSKLEKQLLEKRREYLAIVADMSKVYQKERLLRSRISQTTEVLPKVYQQTYIAGVSSDIDLHRNKGLIFFDNNVVKDAFIKGEA
jgi:hypothetical protein